MKLHKKELPPAQPWLQKTKKAWYRYWLRTLQRVSPFSIIYQLRSCTLNSKLKCMKVKTFSLTAEFSSKSTCTLTLKFSAIWYTRSSIEALDIVEYTTIDFFCFFIKTKKSLVYILATNIEMCVTFCDYISTQIVYS